MVHIHPAEVLSSSYALHCLSSDDISIVQQQPPHHSSPSRSLKNNITRRLCRLFSISSTRKSNTHATTLEALDSPTQQSFLTTTLTDLSCEFEGEDLQDDDAKSNATLFDDDDDYKPAHSQVAIAVILPAAVMAAASAARSRRYHARAVRAATAQSPVRSTST